MGLYAPFEHVCRCVYRWCNIMCTDKNHERPFWVCVCLCVQMEVYTDKYMTRMKANLIGYAEARVAHSKRTYENLGKILSELTAVET